MPVKQDMVVNMAFDPSIILGVKGLELPNPMNAMAQFSQIQNAQNQNALAQYQLSSAQRADEQQRSLYAAAQQPGFKLDFTTAVQYGAPGMAAFKTQQEAQAAGLTQEKLRGEILAQKPKLQNDVSEQFKKQLTNVNDYNSAVNWLDKQYKHPVLGPLMAQMPFEEAVRQIPQDPAKFQEWKAKNALGIEEFIKQNKPSVTAQGTGALTRLLSTPGLGFGGATVVPGSEAAMTATPGDLLADARAKQRLEFDQTKFKWEKDNPTMSIHENGDGTLLAVNTRTQKATPVVYGQTGIVPAPAGIPSAPAPAAAPSIMRQGAGIPGQRAPAIPGMTSVLDQTVPAAVTPPAAVPPVGTPGTPVQGKGTQMTETQSNAAMFGGAMAQAHNTMSDLEKKGVVKPHVGAEVMKGLARLSPDFFGKGENAANSAESAMRQITSSLGGITNDQAKLAQAQISFAIAYLRKTSGAAFGPSELSNTVQEFFPLIGEEKPVMDQKRSARERAIEGMKISTTSEGRKYIDQYAKPQSTALSAKAITHPSFPGFSIPASQ
jgi:hypothetical protein